MAEGYNNVSIRKIADRIEYSPAAIYSYFPSKDDIFFALAEEGFRILSQPRTAAAAAEWAALPPLDRIRTMLWRLYEFSKEHPQYFALLFVDRHVPRITREYERFAFVREIKVRLASQIDECIRAGAFPATVNPMAAFRVLTMGLLGVAVARLSDRLGPGENADDLARDVLDLLIAGIRSGTPLRSKGALPCGEDHEMKTNDVDADARVGATAGADRRVGPDGVIDDTRHD